MDVIKVGSVVTLRHDLHLYMTVIELDGDKTVCEYNDANGHGQRQNYPIATLDPFKECDSEGSPGRLEASGFV